MWHTDETSADTTAHTFVVRLWMEDSDEPGVRRWRGHVTDVIDEERMYVNDLDEILGFISRRLGLDGGRPGRSPGGRPRPPADPERPI
jgi:hypothetical protein